MPTHNPTADIIQCRECGARKPPHRPRRHLCHACVNKRRRAQRANTPAAVARREFYESGFVNCRGCGEIKPRHSYRAGQLCTPCYRAENVERARKYAAANREEINRRARENAPKRREKKREWNRAYQREWQRKRRATPAGRMHGVVSASIYSAIKQGGGEKAHRTSHYIGYPLARLVKWAKDNGYNPPENHIDHITPISYFLARYPDDIVRALRAAWRIGNLRVIPAKENHSKGARREFLI